MSDSKERSGVVSPEHATSPKRDTWVTEKKQPTHTSRIQVHSSAQK